MSQEEVDAWYEDYLEYLKENTYDKKEQERDLEFWLKEEEREINKQYKQFKADEDAQIYAEQHPFEEEEEEEYIGCFYEYGWNDYIEPYEYIKTSNKQMSNK